MNRPRQVPARPSPSRCIAALALATCATGPGGDLSGTWDLAESFAATGGIACSVTGELLLSHGSGDNRFGGIATRQATCTGAPPGFDPGGADEVIEARIEGTDVRFRVDLCTYRGTLSGDRLAGTMACDMAVSGQPTPFQGTWEAARPR